MDVKHPGSGRHPLRMVMRCSGPSGRDDTRHVWADANCPVPGGRKTPRFGPRTAPEATPEDMEGPLRRSLGRQLARTPPSAGRHGVGGAHEGDECHPLWYEAFAPRTERVSLACLGNRPNLLVGYTFVLLTLFSGPRSLASRVSPRPCCWYHPVRSFCKLFPSVPFYRRSLLWGVHCHNARTPFI